MGKKKYEKLSKAQWKQVWKRALKRGICPFDPTHSLKTKTCEHLDDYLNWGQTRGFFAPLPEIVHMAGIEDFENAPENPSHTEGVWKLFKRLRRSGLSNMHILLLIRKYGLKQSRRLIMRELGIRSNAGFDQELKAAVDALRRDFET